MGKNVSDANTYRVGHPLAQRVLEHAREVSLSVAEVRFDLTESRRKIAVLEPLAGSSGWLTCSRLTLTAIETEDVLLLAGVTDAGATLDEAQCRRLFDLPASATGGSTVPPGQAEVLAREIAARKAGVVEEASARNGRYFDIEIEKLDRWAEDRRASLKADLDELDESLKAARKAARNAPNLPEKLERQRAVRTLEEKRDKAWKDYDAAAREIDRKKDALLDDIGRRLDQRIDEQPLFTFRWTIV
jgi:hypothetical protein